MIAVSGDELYSLAAQFTTASAQVRQKASMVVRRSGMVVVNRARQAAPVDTGTLEGSIGMRIIDGGLTAEVTTPVHYAVYQEFGTSRIAPRLFMESGLKAAQANFETAMKQLGGEIL